MNENSTTTRTRPGTAGKVGAALNIIAAITIIIVTGFLIPVAIEMHKLAGIIWKQKGIGGLAWFMIIVIIILIFTTITNLSFFISGSNKALAGILGLISAGIIGGLLVLIDKGSN